MTTAIVYTSFFSLIRITSNHVHEWKPVLYNLKNEEVGWICKCGGQKEINKPGKNWK